MRAGNVHCYTIDRKSGNSATSVSQVRILGVKSARRINSRQNAECKKSDFMVDLAVTSAYGFLNAHVYLNTAVPIGEI